MNTQANGRQRISAGRVFVPLLFLMVSATTIAGQTNTFPNSGNAGVNTTSPPNPLTVARSGSAPYTNRPAYELLQLVDKTDNTPQIVLASANNGMILRYTGTDGVAQNQRLGVLTGGLVEAFVINNDGLVGIGTTTPARTLTVSRSVNPSIAIEGPAIDFSTNQQNAFGAYAEAQESFRCRITARAACG